MIERKLKFAIFGNIYQTKKSVSIQKILSCLSERKADVMVEKEFYDFLSDTQRISLGGVEVFRGADFDSDFVISMGGDGTFLKSAAFVGGKDIPIIGVNMGRLGFLADVSPAEIEHCIDMLYNDDYSVEDRTVIQLSFVSGGKDTTGETSTIPFALNDVAVLKRDNASMITIRATINGEYLTTYQADGLIISTPTGSTAYSLSNGGPILVPASRVLTLTPVAPHSMNIRPIVISDNSEIALTVESRNHNFLVAIDGRSEKCAEGTQLILRKAPYKIKVVKRPGSSYFHTLREKLMWGLDVRG